MKNQTGLPPVDQFDRSIPDAARQELRTETEAEVELTSTSATLTDERATDGDYVEQRRLSLVLVDADTDENEYFGEDPIASASYLFWPADEVALVGGVFVGERFRRRGIGTRLKGYLDNHMRQDGARIAYTWIASEAGEGLARKTGYRPEEDVFPDVEEFWVKEFDGRDE